MPLLEAMASINRIVIGRISKGPPTKKNDASKSFLASLTPIAAINGASTAAAVAAHQTVIKFSSASNIKNNSGAAGLSAAVEEGGTRSGASSEEDQCQAGSGAGADSGSSGTLPKKQQSTLTITAEASNTAAPTASATATPTATTNRLISFYTHPHGGTDSANRTLSEILLFPDCDLEDYHDYIQWLFPLPEASPYNWSAPRIDRCTAEAFRTCPELRERMRESLVRMLDFYGFELITTTTPTTTATNDTTASNSATAGTFTREGCGFEVKEQADFYRKARFWLVPFNHNHLRITRIIRCLRVLGLEHEAQQFHKALVRATTSGPGNKGRVGFNTLKFWKRAAMRPLEVEPADDQFDDEEYERNCASTSAGGGGGS